MVSIADDVRTVVVDMRAAEAGEIDHARLNHWIMCLSFIEDRLRHVCPECGKPMEWDLTLQTYVCHHAENEDTVD